ncbi:hypothetical protein LshimejAT787_4700050 [Lyophyllum shimeji]|uniref:Uncharacterized protein n=1 Tax=Lyophyllum shimeji TaxID=47721 RepID=A0A9P3PZJ3_LYOSH|nr:hypothetical protein LshimejAT787_4700050 [Lyophyllum shimeji]
MDVDATLDDGVEEKTDVFAQLKGMTEKALDANTAHQYALTKYAEQLTAELQEVEKLMDAVTSEDVDEEPDPEVQIPGATKATGLCPTSEFWNPVCRSYPSVVNSISTLRFPKESLSLNMHLAEHVI